MNHETFILHENDNVLTVKMLFEKNLKVCLDNDNERCSDNANDSKKMNTLMSAIHFVQKHVFASLFQNL